MKRFLYITIILSIIGCKNNQTQFPEPIEPPIIEPNVSLKWIDESSDFGYNSDYYMLGHGIDFRKKDFIEISSSKSKVIDINKFINTNKMHDLINRIEKIKLNQSGYCYAYKGIDQLNFSDNISESYSISNYILNEKVPLFIDLVNYVEDSDNYMYFRLDLIVPTEILALSQSTSNYLSEFLTNEFDADLCLLTGDELIDKYGTHVLTEIIIGKALSFTFATYQSTDLFERFVSASTQYYDLITSSIPHSDAKSVFSDFEKVDILIRSINGERFIERNAKSPNNISFDYLPWLQSDTGKSLVGIKHFHCNVQLLSDFIEDTVKKNEIEIAILSHMK